MRPASEICLLSVEIMLTFSQVFPSISMSTLGGIEKPVWRENHLFKSTALVSRRRLHALGGEARNEIIIIAAGGGMAGILHARRRDSGPAPSPTSMPIVNNAREIIMSR